MFSQIDSFIDQYSDQRTIGIYSIWEPIGIVAIYMIFVKKIGPWFMKNRKPLEIKKYVMVFDAIQVVANFYFVISVMNVMTRMQGSYFCLDIDSSDSSTGKTSLYLTKFYYWLKLSDLLDTIFFVMKKSWRQVSYLHVYHHAIMILISWLALKLAPGGHSAYFGLANAMVHTAMYTYYLLSAYDSSYKKNIALKKIVTQIQLLQFIFLIVMFTPSLGSSCSFPTVIALAAVSQSAYFLYLFGMFYFNTYVKDSRANRRR